MGFFLSSSLSIFFYYRLVKLWGGEEDFPDHWTRLLWWGWIGLVLSIVAFIALLMAELAKT